MSTRTIIAQVKACGPAVLLSATALILALGGCASTEAVKSVTGPGTPDAMQLKHYEMLKSAIEGKSKTDAMAALAGLQSDVSRWQANILTTMNAMVDQAALTDIVEQENWDLAHKKFLELKAKYRDQQWQ